MADRAHRLVRNAADIRQAVLAFNRDARRFRSRGLSELATTKYWVYSAADSMFGPGKFVGLRGMTFRAYDDAVRHGGGPQFDGNRTQRAIHKIAPFRRNGDLSKKLDQWGRHLYGVDVFGSVDRSKWAFAVIEEPREFLVYWKSEEIASGIENGFLDHAGSDQFGSLHQGDVLWICGQWRNHRLVLIGPLRLDEMPVSRSEARRRWPDVIDRQFHAYTDDRESTRVVPLGSLLSRLRFKSKISDRLDVAKPLGQQLQRIRRLTPRSAALLWTVWHKTLRTPDPALKDLGRMTAKGSLDTIRQVATRKEQAYLRKHLFSGQATGKCVLCGRDYPVDLLVAAHVKPRAKCSRSEKLDKANVVAMCLFGCDALFERAYVNVRDGKVQIARRPKGTADFTEHVQGLIGRHVPAWHGRERLFGWHARQPRRNEA